MSVLNLSNLLHLIESSDRFHSLLPGYASDFFRISVLGCGNELNGWMSGDIIRS